MTPQPMDAGPLLAWTLENPLYAGRCAIQWRRAPHLDGYPLMTQADGWRAYIYDGVITTLVPVQWSPVPNLPSS